jgi:hypothetical protein
MPSSAKHLHVPAASTACQTSMRPQQPYRHSLSATCAPNTPAKHSHSACQQTYLSWQQHVATTTPCTQWSTNLYPRIGTSQLHHLCHASEAMPGTACVACLTRPKHPTQMKSSGLAATQLPHNSSDSQTCTKAVAAQHRLRSHASSNTHHTNVAAFRKPHNPSLMPDHVLPVTCCVQTK